MAVEAKENIASDLFNLRQKSNHEAEARISINLIYANALHKSNLKTSPSKTNTQVELFWRLVICKWRLHKIIFNL